MKVYLKKILSDSIKNKVLLFLMIWPCFEIIYYVYTAVYYKSGVLKPYLCFFLSGNSAGIGHIFQAVFLWFLPLYLLIINSEDVIEEQRTRLELIIVSKVGKRKYIETHLRKSFVLSFLFIFAALMYNLLLVNIIFCGGINDRSGGISVQSQLLVKLYGYPVFAEVLFSVIVAWCAALISALGTMLTFAFRERKMVYSFTMLLWFIPFLMEPSLMLLFQPFSEYDLDVLIPLLLYVSIVYILIIVFLYMREVFYVHKKNI